LCKNFSDKMIKIFLITSPHLQNFHPPSKFSTFKNFSPSKISHSKNMCAAYDK
jgi:hypothetical protein